MVSDWPVCESSRYGLAAWFFTIAGAMTLSGCFKAEAKPSDLPELSEPYTYSNVADEFTGTKAVKAERTDLKLEKGLVLRTSFLCMPSTKSQQVALPENAFFAFSLQTGQGAPVVPLRIRFKLDDQPPFDGLWSQDADPHPETFIVPYQQIVAAGVSQEDRYSAAWTTGMTPYLDNPFQLDLIEPKGELDFDQVAKRGDAALAQKAATAKRLMIRYTLADNSEQDVDINLDDPAIRTVLSDCGWKLDAAAAGSSIAKEQRLSWQDLQPHWQSIIIFSNNARWCREDGKRGACSVARDELTELASKGICPVGDPGRQVWGRCLANSES